jgi:hypothetical protein
LLLAVGCLQEQAGEKLDRLGLLSRAEAGKPRAAEPKFGIAQNNLLQRMNGAGPQTREGAPGANIPLYKRQGPKRPRNGHQDSVSTLAKGRPWLNHA